MKAERLKLREIILGGVASDAFQRMITRIHGGALFVYPTETIYGIGGVAVSSVKERLYKVKKRQDNNPLILIAGQVSVFSAYNVVFNKTAKKLADTFWPGRLTLILPVAGTGEKIGIRVSDHPFIQMLSEHVALPLYSSSANMSNTEYVNDPDHIYHIFSDEIDMMIDDGVLPQSLPSTVVDVSQDGETRIVREGAVSKNAIEEVLFNQR